MQCGVIDEEVDVVGAQLTRKVLENYNAFISGMRGIQVRAGPRRQRQRRGSFARRPHTRAPTVQDLDLDLTRAGIHVSNGRRVIRNAQERLVAVRARGSCPRQSLPA